MGTINKFLTLARILLFIASTFFAFPTYAVDLKELPVYNPSFEDWNDSYPLFDNYTTSVPTGWHLQKTGYSPCDAVMKQHTRYAARTGQYAAFFNSSSHSNALISDSYTLSEGTYSFNVYAANIGYGNTQITLKISGAVSKSSTFYVNGNSGKYSQYSISFNMETDGTVQFTIDNSKEWDGNTTICNFAVDDWSLTTSDGQLINSDRTFVVDETYQFYLYNNGSAELIKVLKNISGQAVIPETVLSEDKSYVVRDIAPYAFASCSALSGVVFPKRLYNIGRYAFNGCSSLESVLFPTYLTSIGDFAFADSPNLHEAVFFTKVKPTFSNTSFHQSVKFYVPDITKYQDCGYEIHSMCSPSSELVYSGIKPQIDWVMPGGVSLISWDENSLGYNAGLYKLTASYSSYGMNVDGIIPITIIPAPLIVKSNNYEREYGDENPSFEASVSGIKNNEAISTIFSNGLMLYSDATSSSDIGKYPIKLLSELATKNYSLQYIEGYLTIDKAPISISVASCSRKYGDPNVNFVLSYDGLKNGENIPKWDIQPVFKTQGEVGSNVGEYEISVEAVAHNYNIIQINNGILTITKAPLTLTVKNASRLYFDENPPFDFSLEGLRNGDGKSIISTQPNYTCNATMNSNVGVYDIVPSNAQATNYDISYNNGHLSITKRALSASALSYSRYYGEENPDFEISYSGFVNGEDHSVLTNPVMADCTANKTSDVGTYPIRLHGGEAINYEVKSYTSGKLTIEKANQTITWDQDLSNITMGTQLALNAASSSGLPVSYEMSPNNVATLYSNNGIWYLDCYASGAVNIRASHAGDKNHNPSDVVTKTLVVFGGGGSDPSNPQIYLHIEEPGTLPSLIAENRKYQIRNLRLSGYLNGTDINYIREMAGSDAYGNITPGVLESLDISSCSIVSGGRSYFSQGVSCYTSNNSIGDYMFYNCGVLVNLLLPTNATILEDYALANCARLSTLSLPNGITSIGREAFRNDIGLLRIPMPEQLVSIGDKAFIGCNNLTEIDIPANVRFIGDGIVKDCENISRINVDATNQYFSSKDGVLFDYDCTTLKIFPMNNPSLTYKVMNGVTRIAPYSFVNAKKLTEVTLPSSLLTIGTDAFIGCVNLNVLHTEAIVPPVCDNDCFESVSKTRCELQVPQGCYSAYWVAPVWSEFNKIVENGSGSIIDVSMDNIEVSVDGLNIMVTGIPNGIYVCIYQMNGLLIYQQRSKGEDISYQPATPGTYIVAVGDKTFKILIK